MQTISLPLIYPVTGHTDFVGAGSTFVAIPGTKQDGLSYVSLALQKGATTIVVQDHTVLSQELQDLICLHQATLKFVPDVRQALSELSAQALNFPAKKLKIAGITGTKGKTSTSYMAYHALHNLGYKVALVSTVEKRIGAAQVQISLTTPLPDQLQMFLAACVDHGVEYVIMEVSAQALTLARVDGIEFDAGVFTNFSHEHLEFYKNLDEYFQAKTLLLAKVKNLKNMFVNQDDQRCHQLLKQQPQCSSFSLTQSDATIFATAEFNDSVTAVSTYVEGICTVIQLPLIGLFNVYNLLGVVAIFKAFGIDVAQLERVLMNLSYVPGRMEQYRLKNGARCFIDFAHNPSSFEAVLSTLRSMTQHLIVVFGAGGNRDPQKRPIMGSIAQKYCDIIILTSDNPRDENPIDIAHDIQLGFASTPTFEFYQELNRVKAIELGQSLTKQGSILAILGKGRDEYQIVGGLTFPFKERAIIRPFIIEQD